jgi:hypothetical protein
LMVTGNSSMLICSCVYSMKIIRISILIGGLGVALNDGQQ